MNSIYYKIYGHNRLWLKDKLDDNPEIIDKQKLMVKSKNYDYFIKKIFIINENKLILWRNNLTILGYLNLYFIGIKTNKEELKITFFNNKKFFDIFFEDTIIYKMWKKILINKSILNNIHTKFNVIKKLISNEYKNLYLFEKKSNNKKYIVEIVSKNYLDLNKNYSLFLSRINLLRNKKFKKNKWKYLYEDYKRFYLIMDNYNIYFNNLKNKKIINEYFNSPKWICFTKSELKINFIINRLMELNCLINQITINLIFKINFSEILNINVKFIKSNSLSEFLKKLLNLMNYHNLLHLKFNDIQIKRIKNTI